MRTCKAIAALPLVLALAAGCGGLQQALTYATTFVAGMGTGAAGQRLADQGAIRGVPPLVTTGPASAAYHAVDAVADRVETLAAAVRDFSERARSPAKQVIKGWSDGEVGTLVAGIAGVIGAGFAAYKKFKGSRQRKDAELREMIEATVASAAGAADPKPRDTA